MHTCGVNLLFSKQKVLFVLLIVGGTDFGIAAELNVFPTEINLRYSTDLQRIVAVSHGQDGSREVTEDVTFVIEDPSVVEINSAGIARPKSNGTTSVTVKFGDTQTQLRVGVTDYELEGPVSFELHIQPILAARGCSTGPCHGKARGQNLSLIHI